MRGFWNMPCWNGLGPLQQRRLIEHGNLPIGWQPEAMEPSCHKGAQCCIETEEDEAPGPRFYCYECAIEYLKAKL